MKKLIAFLTFAIVLCGSAAPPQKSISIWWTHSPTPAEELSGYTVYAGTKLTALSPQSKVSYVNTTTVSLPNGTWYIAVVARNKQGVESAFSNTVTAKLPSKAPPQDVQITHVTIKGDNILIEIQSAVDAWVGIETSEDMKKWNEPLLWQFNPTGRLTFGLSISGPKKFFRAVVQ